MNVIQMDTWPYQVAFTEKTGVLELIRVDG